MSHRHTLRHLAGRVRAATAEMRYASARAASLAVSPERYLGEPDAAPATYAEFLLRSAMTLPHEPSARERARHRQHR